MDSDNHLIEPSTVLATTLFVSSLISVHAYELWTEKQTCLRGYNQCNRVFSTACVLTLDKNSDVKIKTSLIYKRQENPNIHYCRIDQVTIQVSHHNVATLLESGSEKGLVADWEQKFQHRRPRSEDSSSNKSTRFFAQSSAANFHQKQVWKQHRHFATQWVHFTWIEHGAQIFRKRRSLAGQSCAGKPFTFLYYFINIISEI